MSRSLPQVEGYTFQACIGSGTFGEVYKGIRNRDGLEIAGKVIMESKLKTKKLRESLEKEASIQSTAKHPNIVSLLEVIKLPQETILIMEYCDGGDLAEFLEKRKRLPEDVAKKFLQQIVAALDFMNDRRIIHRDIKPKNILLTTRDENATLKLADFGFARIIDYQGVADTQCGTPLYMAPEVSLGKKYGLKADLWSIGCIFYEMVVGSRPYEAATQLQLAEAIKNKPVTFPPGLQLSDACKNLILKLLQKDQTLRISQVELFMDPFLDYLEYSKSNPYFKEKEELLKSKIALEKMDHSPDSTKKIIEDFNKMIESYEVIERNEPNEESPVTENKQLSSLIEDDFEKLDTNQIRLNQMMDDSKMMSKSTLRQGLEFTDQFFKSQSKDSQDIFTREILDRKTNPDHNEVSEIIFHTLRLLSIQKSADYYKNGGNDQEAFLLYTRCIEICKTIVNLLSSIYEENEKLPKQLSGAPLYISQMYNICMESAQKTKPKNKQKTKEIVLGQAKLIVKRARELAGDGGFNERDNIEVAKSFYTQSLLHFETVIIDFSHLLKGNDEFQIKDQITKITDRLQAIESK